MNLKVLENLKDFIVLNRPGGNNDDVNDVTIVSLITCRIAAGRLAAFCRPGCLSTGEDSTTTQTATRQMTNTFNDVIIVRLLANIDDVIDSGCRFPVAGKNGNSFEAAAITLPLCLSWVLT